MKRKGLTCVELLVVLALIAIMVAILWPVFAKAGAKARQSYCMANVKQLAFANLMYASDHNNKLPILDRLHESGQRSVFEDLYPYVRNHEILECPEDKTDGRPLFADTAIRPSYGVRAESSGLHSEAIEDRETYPLILDLGGKLEIWSKETPLKPTGHVQPLFDLEHKVVGLPVQHNHGINIGFADGHCKYWLTEALYANFKKTAPFGSDQLEAPPHKPKTVAPVEDDTVIVTLSTPLPPNKRFLLVYNGVVQYSGTNK